MGRLAELYSVELIIDGLGVSDACIALLDALDHQPWPAVTRWASPVITDGGEWRTTAFRAALEAGALAGEDDVEWRQGDELKFTVGSDGDDLHLSCSILDTAEEHAWRWLVATEEVLARLLDAGIAIRHGTVDRIGGVHCIPRLPLVGGPSFLVVTHDAALAACFTRPDAVFTEGGWQSRELGDRWLLSRALHAETNVEMLEAIQDGQWAMARIAKRGKTDYASLAAPEPDEKDLFFAGEAGLGEVGYDAEARTAYYSCAVEPDEHIQGWEILALRDALRAKQLPDARPLARVDVVFVDEAMARREARPLLDVGVTVFYYDAGGDRVALTDREPPA